MTKLIELPPAFGYQGYARKKVTDRRRTAVIAPPGAGKTRPIVEGVNDLGGFSKPVLVLCTGSAVPTWKRQIPLWSECSEYADYITVGRGNIGDRMDIWDRMEQEQYGTIVTNFSVFRRDFGMIQRIPWETVIADEYHKAMRSHKKSTKKGPKTYGLFCKMTRHTPNLLLATGSLARRNASSMFTAFQSILPKLFPSYWRYVNTYCYIDEGRFGQQIYGVKNGKRLRELMDRYFAYLPPEVVADSLPKGRRYAIVVEITDEQRKIYKDLDEDMISIIQGTVIITSTHLGKLTKQRQLLCCPKILDPSLGMGGGYEAIVDKLDQDDHVVIFVPYRAACDYVLEDLKKKGYEDVFIMRGGVDDVEQQQICDDFRRTRGIMVCTIQYAESFDLDSCKTSYFLGYDLTVDQNEQAEGRTRRAISTHEFVTWGYIRTDTSVDQHFLQKLGDDANNVGLIIARAEEYIRMVMAGVRS